MSVYNNSQKGGFTLIELIVSIALLTLTLFGVAEIFSRSLGVTHRAQQLTRAVELAQAQIENTISLDYSLLTIGTFEARNNVFDVFDRETTVTYIDPFTFTTQPQDTGLKRVTVRMFYPSIFGEQSFALETMKTNR